MKRSDLTQVIYDANNGIESAKIYLGSLYYEGKEVRKDREKAIKLWNECVDNNNIQAILTIASIYILENNVDLAIPYLKKGIELKSGESAYILFQVLNEKNDSSCLEYLDTACSLDFIEACYTKAEMISDVNERISLLQKASRLPEAMYSLGQIYLLENDHINYKEALHLFKQSAKLGVQESNFFLGNIYLHGLGVKPNSIEAARYFKLGAESADCLNNLGILYLNGDGIKQSNKDAFRCFQKAANKGSIDGKYNLALSYINGVICQKNLDEGIRLLKYCADKEYLPAYQTLSEIYVDNNPELSLYYRNLYDEKKQIKEK